MNTLDLTIGSALPSLHTGPITRHRVAMYAHGSGDLNAIHVDSDYAREKAGLPDVIVHGMYSMGMLSRLLTQWAGPGSVRSIETRFATMLPINASLNCVGVIEALQETNEGSLVTVRLAATQPDGSPVATGSAQVFLAAGQ
jgi:acyl dehydratase